MAGNDRDPSSKGPFRRFLDWWLSPATTRAANVLLGVLATALAALLGAVAALALRKLDLIDFEGDWPAWLGASIVAVAFVTGVTIGALITRAVFKAHRAVRERLETYARHLLFIQQGLGARVVDVEKEVLAPMAELLSNGIGAEVCVSLWEPSVEGAVPVWKLIHGRDHTQNETEAFSGLPLSASWISQMQGPAGDEPFRIEDLAADIQPGKDLQTFKDFGYRSLICARVPALPANSDEQAPNRCLVVLAKEARAFQKGEARYVQFLARLLGTHEYIAELRRQAGIASEGSGESSRAVSP